MQKELDELKGKQQTQEEKQKASTLRVVPALKKDMKKQQATPVVADGSTDNRQFRSSNNTYVTEFITDPVAQNRYANPVNVKKKPPYFYEGFLV